MGRQGRNRHHREGVYLEARPFRGAARPRRRQDRPHPTAAAGFEATVTWNRRSTGGVGIMRRFGGVSRRRRRRLDSMVGGEAPGAHAKKSGGGWAPWNCFIHLAKPTRLRREISSTAPLSRRLKLR
jgi:hypothetical protein